MKRGKWSVGTYKWRINLDEISMEELENEMTEMGTGRAGAGNRVEPEYIKCLGSKGREWLLEIIRLSWQHEKNPKDWKANIIISINKKRWSHSPIQHVE